MARAEIEAKAVTEKLFKTLPRRQFDTKIQAMTKDFNEQSSLLLAKAQYEMVRQEREFYKNQSILFVH
mgnify:CR=1 FL=1